MSPGRAGGGYGHHALTRIDVTDDTNHRQPIIADRARATKATTHGALSRPQELAQGVAHEHQQIAVERFGLRESAPEENRYV